MREVLKQVKTKNKVVAEVNVPVYETVEEIINSESAERIIAVFNNGNHVRIMGNERAKYSGTKTGKKLRRKMAFNCLTTDELMARAQDSDALEAFLNSPEIQARVDAQIAAEGGEVEAVETAEVQAE